MAWCCQLDRFYDTFVELVVKDKKQEQINQLAAQVTALGQRADELEGKMAEQSRALQASQTGPA